MFIQIDVDDAALSPSQKEQIARVCPVEIFKVEAGHLTVRPEQVDECILCELCLEAPAGAITIRRTYSPKTLVSRGTQKR